MTEHSNESTLSDVLTRMEQLDEQIKSVGMTKQNFQIIRDLITEYDELELALDAKRQEQFKATAYDFLVTQRIAQSKNITALTAFLRRFALHVASHIGMHDVEELIDRIPEMIEKEE